MKMPFGKYKGMEMSGLPVSYLQWVVANFEPGEIRDNAAAVLQSNPVQEERRSESLEQQANKILGEKPVAPLKRGFRHRGSRRK